MTVKVIQPKGLLDGVNGNQLQQEVATTIQAGASQILINFESVSFMDSSGLGALVIALKRVREAGRRLALCSLNDQVKMLLDLTDMDGVFEIFGSQEEFNRAAL
ncbi:MAG TPA: STAS domain-containing protein [Trichocoleus sp.]|jgi:anti-anti-sigma factor